MSKCDDMKKYMEAAYCEGCENTIESLSDILKNPIVISALANAKNSVTVSAIVKRIIENVTINVMVDSQGA